jgi:hypothetical protein
VIDLLFEPGLPARWHRVVVPLRELRQHTEPLRPPPDGVDADIMQVTMPYTRNDLLVVTQLRLLRCPPR